MNYKSNLAQPDIWHNFQHVHFRPQGQSFGHDVPSDWADKADDDPIFGIWKRCGSFTHDEGAILAACAAQYRRKAWCDIGCNTGISSRLICDQTGAGVDCVDYMLGLVEFRDRFKLNTNTELTGGLAFKSDDFFAAVNGLASFEYSGFLIDGDHDRPQPLKDAQNAARHLTNDGVIVFHDFYGEPVQEAVTWLMAHDEDCYYFGARHGIVQNPELPCQCGRGFKARIYKTPHGVAVCWRGDTFKPPEHVPDQNLPDLFSRCPNFAFERCV